MAVLTFHDLFAITELGESILLELPIQELLLTAQRVSKQWKNIIDCSPRLQQALFFQPLPGPPIQLYHTTSRAPKYFFAESLESEAHILTIGNPFIEKINVNRYGRQKHLIKRVGASWRRMLVCQPAMTVISFPCLQPTGRPFGSTSDDRPPHQIVREKGVLLRQALFEDDHIREGFSGVANELQHFGQVKMAWEVRRVEKD